MKGRLLLDVVICKSSTILKLFSCENQTLLIRWNALLVLNLGLYVRNGIRRLDIQRNSLTCQSFHKDLHTSSESKNQVKSGFLLDVVVRESSAIFELFSCEDKTLLVRWNALLVLNFGLHVGDSIRGLNIQRDSLSSKSFDEYLHTSSQS